jgi:Flp pilus assembly protein TadD
MAVPRLAWSSAGAALATAACVWLLVGSGRVMWSQRPGRELQALVAAVGTGRTIEPRLVGGFAHGPLLEAVRGRATADVVSPDVRIAAATLEKAVNERPTAQNLRALGAAHLIMGQFDTAIDALQSAVRQAPTDATVLSDLSAAYLVRGKNEGAPEDYARAASQADKATKANAVLPEALFNRALAFEALSLAREARESWEQYLRLDGRSAWADEARRHLQKLLQQSDARGSRPFILKEKRAMVT